MADSNHDHEIRCHHCAGPLTKSLETSEWTVSPFIRDSFSMIGSAVGGTASAFIGFNHVMPIVRKWIKGPMWLHFLVGAPPVIVLSSACAGLAGLRFSSPPSLLFSIVEHKNETSLYIKCYLWFCVNNKHLNLECCIFLWDNVCRWHCTGAGTARFIFIPSSSPFVSATAGRGESQNAEVYNISSVKHTAQLLSLQVSRWHFDYKCKHH
ncbi:unnamed protein product [Brassica rapa subsp. trilocularis]